jgi:hypothetical protein
MSENIPAVCIPARALCFDLVAMMRYEVEVELGVEERALFALSGNRDPATVMRVCLHELKL